MSFIFFTMIIPIILSTWMTLSSYIPTTNTTFKEQSVEVKVKKIRKALRLHKKPKLQDTGNGKYRFVKQGLASWYGAEEHGKLTASGKRYNMYEYTAAVPAGKGCRRYFGKKYRVTNRKNHKSVVVTITDTGGFAKYNRAIDLSYAAAKKLNMVQAGVVPVTIEELIN